MLGTFWPAEAGAFGAGVTDAQARLLISGRRSPARPQPHRFVAAQGQPTNHLADDLKRLIPSRVAATKFSLLRLTVVRENPLLSVRVLEVPHVQRRVVAVDGRWIAALGDVDVADAKQWFGHDSTWRETSRVNSSPVKANGQLGARHPAHDRPTRGLSGCMGLRATSANDGRGANVSRGSQW
jgi:hypothetical protein